MTTSNDISTAEKQKTIIIKRTLDLPLSTVWKAWTEPESFKKWWGPEGYTCPDCRLDPREGGKYLYSMKGPDGKKIWGAGEYLEVVPKNKIIYLDRFADEEGNTVPASYYNMAGEWPEEMLVTVSLDEVAGKTNMTLAHSDLPAEMADDCIKGWQSSFDKMERELA